MAGALLITFIILFKARHYGVEGNNVIKKHFFIYKGWGAKHFFKDKISDSLFGLVFFSHNTAIKGLLDKL